MKKQVTMKLGLFIYNVITLLLLCSCATKPVHTSVCFVNYRTLVALCGATTIDKRAINNVKEGDMLLFVVDSTHLYEFPFGD